MHTKLLCYEYFNGNLVFWGGFQDMTFHISLCRKISGDKLFTFIWNLYEFFFVSIWPLLPSFFPAVKYFWPIFLGLPDSACIAHWDIQHSFHSVTLRKALKSGSPTDLKWVGKRSMDMSWVGESDLEKAPSDPLLLAPHKPPKNLSPAVT